LILGRSAAALVSILVFAVCAFASVTAANASKKVATGASTADAGAARVLFRGGSNILLIGSDARTDQQGNPLSAAELAAVSTQADGGGVITDTIMVMHIPQGGGQASGISLPRDTWIPPAVTNMVKGPYDDGTQGPYQPNKINSFYGTAKFYTQARDRRKGGMTAAQVEVDSNNAGRTELQAVVQAFTGLRIDHYAEINLIGFYTLSNAIGGVPVCLNSPVNDPYSGAHFKAGPQQISGSAAMSFVRQRHGLPQGDLDRVRRQQAFLAGATSKMLSAGTLTSPSKLSSLTDAASRSLALDSGFDLLSFASQMADLSGGQGQLPHPAHPRSRRRQRNGRIGHRPRRAQNVLRRHRRRRSHPNKPTRRTTHHCRHCHHCHRPVDDHRRRSERDEDQQVGGLGIRDPEIRRLHRRPGQHHGRHHHDQPTPHDHHLLPLQQPGRSRRSTKSIRRQRQPEQRQLHPQRTHPHRRRRGHDHPIRAPPARATRHPPRSGRTNRTC